MKAAYGQVGKSSKLRWLGMNCKRIQEFIITDYIDGQMGDKQKALLINIWLIVLPVRVFR
jgi:hypothetical protein